MSIELIGGGKIALNFNKGFYDPQLKDLIKFLPYTAYD